MPGTLTRRAANPGDQVGEAAGTITGVVSGVAIGSVAGPVGSLIGGVAGAIGGWWIGRGMSEAAERVTDEDDVHYREDFDRRRLAGSFESAQPGYRLGHYAALNPEYAGQDFDAVAPELRRGWEAQPADTSADWTTMSEYAREGFRRGRESSTGSLAGRTPPAADVDAADRNSAALEAAAEGEEQGADTARAEAVDLSPELIDYVAHDPHTSTPREASSSEPRTDGGGVRGP
ncbi:MAG: hypothetical protein NVS4B3_04580 [Gemmatimonadaceae bacterium]